MYPTRKAIGAGKRGTPNARTRWGVGFGGVVRGGGGGGGPGRRGTGSKSTRTMKKGTEVGEREVTGGEGRRRNGRVRKPGGRGKATQTTRETKELDLEGKSALRATATWSCPEPVLRDKARHTSNSVGEQRRLEDATARRSRAPRRWRRAIRLAAGGDDDPHKLFARAGKNGKRSRNFRAAPPEICARRSRPKKEKSGESRRNKTKSSSGSRRWRKLGRRHRARLGAEKKSGATGRRQVEAREAGLAFRSACARLGIEAGVGRRV